MNFATLGRTQPPCVIRIDVDQAFGSTILSECDAHFFAHMLHMFPQIPFVHVHVLCSREAAESHDPEREASLAAQRRHTATSADINNACPFQPPIREMTKLENELRQIARFCQAVPVSMKVMLSIIPKIPVETGLKIQDDGNILLMQTDAELEEKQKNPADTVLINKTGPAGIFGHLVEKLVKRKRNRLRKQWNENNQNLPDEEKTPFPVPTKPLYVNNINSQRLHDCFRTLYGNDDVHLTHPDIYTDKMIKYRIGFPRVDSDVLLELLTTITSLDLQHLFLTESPLSYDAMLLGGSCCWRDLLDGNYTTTTVLPREHVFLAVSRPIFWEAKVLLN